jgi:hypothetical protein
MCFQYILIRFIPLSHSPLFLEEFQQVSLLYFQTWIQNTSTMFTLLCSLHLPSPLPMIPTTRQVTFLSSHPLLLTLSPLLFNSLQCMMLHYLHTEMHCISCIHIILCLASSLISEEYASRSPSHKPIRSHLPVYGVIQVSIYL